MHSMLRNKKTIAILVIPGLLLLAFAVFFPIVMSFYYGLSRWNGIGALKIIGLQNYERALFNDPVFWRSLWNALLLSLGIIFIQHPLCTFFAILVDNIQGRLEKLFRALIFVPCVISVVVTAKMWVSIYNYDFGMLNRILDAINLGHLKQDWLGNINYVMIALLVVIMWNGFGRGFLYYYAGVKGISQELIEAARIDGCGGIMVHFKITIPMLKPVIRINFTLAVISALKQMEIIMLTTNGGPMNYSQFLANYLYKCAFDSYEYGYGNAISFLFVIICILATVLFNKLIAKQDMY